MENTVLAIHNSISTVCSRLQLQGERAGGGTSTEYRGMVRTALGIAREEVSTTGVEYWGMVRTALCIAREEMSTTGVENWGMVRTALGIAREEVSTGNHSRGVLWDGPHSAGHSQGGGEYHWSRVPEVGCARNKQRKISVQTETRSVSGLFWFVSWNQKLKFSICFGVSNLYWNNLNKQLLRNNRNNPKFS